MGTSQNTDTLHSTLPSPSLPRTSPPPSPPTSPTPSLPIDTLLEIISLLLLLSTSSSRYSTLGNLALVSREWNEAVNVLLYSCLVLRGKEQVCNFAKSGPRVGNVRELRIYGMEDGEERVGEAEVRGAIKMCEGMKGLRVEGLRSLSPSLLAMDSMRDSPVWGAARYASQLRNLVDLSIDAWSFGTLPSFFGFIESIPSRLETMRVVVDVDLDDSVWGSSTSLPPLPTTALAGIKNLILISTDESFPIPSVLVQSCPSLSRLSFSGAISFPAVLSTLQLIPRSVTSGLRIVSPWMDDEEEGEEEGGAEGGTSLSPPSLTSLKTLALPASLICDSPSSISRLLSLESMQELTRIEVRGFEESIREAVDRERAGKWGRRWRELEEGCRGRIGIVLVG